MNDLQRTPQWATACLMGALCTVQEVGLKRGEREAGEGSMPVLTVV
jgi:hypothetical protein